MPRNGKLSQHKHRKMGQLPGDLCRNNKISLLESSVSELESAQETGQMSKRNYWPFEPKHAKTFKKEFVRKANRSIRHKPVVREIE